MAPERLAEWPVRPSSRYLAQHFDVWALVLFPLPCIEKRKSAALPLGFSASVLTANENGHSLVHSGLLQQTRVLVVPFAAWSVFDFLIFRAIVFASQSTATSPILSSVTSHARSIQETVIAYNHAGLVYAPLSRHFISQASWLRSAICNSLALISGPRCLFSALLHRYSCLSRGELHSKPASTCINFTSWRYWSPDCSCASSNAVATLRIDSWVAGKCSSPTAATSSSLTFFLLAFFARSVPYARNFFLNVSLAFFRSFGALASFKASLMPGLDLSNLPVPGFLSPLLSSPPGPTCCDCSSPASFSVAGSLGLFGQLLCWSRLMSLVRATMPSPSPDSSLVLLPESWLTASLCRRLLAISLLTVTKCPVLRRLLACGSSVAPLLGLPSLNIASNPCRPSIVSSGTAAAHIACKTDTLGGTIFLGTTAIGAARGSPGRVLSAPLRLRPMTEQALGTSSLDVPSPPLGPV